MTDIVIREVAASPDGVIEARVDFGQDGGADVRVADPADAEQEQLLAWYFEKHLEYPFLDKDLEEKAAAQIDAYGQALFGQVFGGEAAYGYRRARDRGFDGCRLVVEGSAAMHRLHWEALQDPDTRGGRLALRLPVVRRVDRIPLQFELPLGRSVVRILVITARPDGPRDIGYRTISRPLLDAVRQARLPVAVDIVRPGTWEALRDRLRATSREHGTGFYQIVHFDVHGGFGNSSSGRGRHLFQGKQGFLYFETDKPGVARPIASSDVAQLLAEHRVAVAVLNACQSARQTGSEASLAQDLVAAGSPVAVGMAYSVTVSAAARAMPVFYEQLASGADPVAATWVMRQELHDHKARLAYFDQNLYLEDWMLPVVFGQRDLSLPLRAMDPDEQEEFYARQARVSAEPAIEYGFVGRDLDIHSLERLLLLDTNRNQALVRGMAGAGKSTLLTHVAWWWQRTGLVERVFSFTYLDRAWSADQITRHIATVLFGSVEFARWESLSLEARQAQIAARLRATRHLLILDNAESITASPAAIPHALSQVERDCLAQFVAALRGGRTLVLVGSRQDETWLAGSNTYELPGLDPQAASALLERIIDRHGGGSHLTDMGERKALNDLMKLLDGYPLQMMVVLPQLAATSPSQILEELSMGEDHADPVGAVRRAIEYSYSKLDPAIQRSMPMLAPFTAVIPVFALEADQQAAVQALTRVGLATAHPMLDGRVKIVPVLPFFLRNRLHDQSELRDIAHQAHYRLYSRLGSELHQLLMGKTPEERAAGSDVTTAEYANLTTAIDHGLRTGQPILDIIRAVALQLQRAQQHDTRRQLLDRAIREFGIAETQERQWELIVLHGLAGTTALTQRRFDDALTHYEIELAMKRAAGLRRHEGGTYHQLGRLAEEQRQLGQAERYYLLALEIFLEFGERHGAATTYGQLGMVAQELRRWEQAESHYAQALEIFVESHDRQSTASTYHQLGLIAQEQDRWEQAERYYRQALDIRLEFGDWYSVARTLHNLGAVAQEQGRWEEAERDYRQALELRLKFNDRLGAARTYNNLGGLAQAQGRWGQAEEYYRQALDIKLTFEDRYGAVGTYHNLGWAMSKLGRHSGAVEAWLHAIALEHAEAGGWPEDTLGALRQERDLLPPDEFERSVGEIVPVESRDEFYEVLGGQAASS